jgi:hypothetical protein
MIFPLDTGSCFINMHYTGLFQVVFDVGHGIFQRLAALMDNIDQCTITDRNPENIMADPG